MSGGKVSGGIVPGGKVSGYSGTSMICCTAVRGKQPSSLLYSVDNSPHDRSVPSDHVTLMPPVDDNGLFVSRALVVHPPRRRNRQTPSMHP